MSMPCIHVIACDGLATEIRRVAQELGLDIKTTYLPEGLPSNPAEMRRRLQATIDEVSAAAGVSQIAIAYGVRGRGTVGLNARHVPLAIPRVHDDISLFLGSDVTAPIAPASLPPVPVTPGHPDEPGSDHTEAMEGFLRSWKQYYQRTAFIDVNSPEHRRYAQMAEEMAARYGWKREPLPGCNPQLRKLIAAQHTDHDVLWVAPHHVVKEDPMQGGLQAVPLWKLDRGQDEAREARDEIIEVGSADDAGTQARLGLGIDAGGTYTDVVLYEFATDRVVQKAKALTTKWDYTIGISSALDQLDPAHLTQVDLVSVSTTLATNAVVEGRGQKVGLLIMPPYGLFDSDDITHRPIAVVKGQLEVDGVVRSPIDPEEIRRVARQMVDHEQVGAFAVTGFASDANPDHEIEVRRILQEETGLWVTCGHDVSEQLNYRVRAQTAALNSRIIPILVAFLRDAAKGLKARGITAPMMVVRSDGSLMSVETAGKCPIETILSGPAASVAGAQHLARNPSAFVVDVGGTTTDTALILGGAVRTSRHGAKVGGWQTHVQALDMRTCGLGGDSLIANIRGELRIGPRRVRPMAWLGGQRVDLEPCLKWIQERIDRNAVGSDSFDVYTLNGRSAAIALSPREQRIVDVLSQRPHSGDELSVRALDHWSESLELTRLEELHIVQRCGLTPTDLLHVTGRFVRWDTAAARRMLWLMSQTVDLSPEQLVERVNEQFVRRLAMEVLKKQMDEEVNADGLEEAKLARILIDNWLRGGSAHYQVQIRLKHPIIGIGAPVGHFLPQAAALLQTQAIVPEHADVANALGAITTSVVIQRHVEISPNMKGQYAVQGIPQAPTFAELREARTAAMKYLQEYVTQAARDAGTRQSRIQFTVHDRVAPLADGSPVFIAQTIEARLTGRPDLARLAPVPR